MSRRVRVAVVAVVAGALLLAGVGSALALQEEDSPDAGATIDLDTVKEKVLDRIAHRIEWFERKIEELADEEGVVAEQRVALYTEGIAIFEQLSADIEDATNVEEIIRLSVEARREYRAHRRVRGFYVHIQQDIDKFGRRLGFLERAIERADEAGLDTTEAAAEAAVAGADLDAAQTLLDAIDPSSTGEEVVDALREAHRTAHSGQSHIRAGWQELREAKASADAA